MKLIKFRIL